jgi:hypothetical protein
VTDDLKETLWTLAAVIVWESWNLAFTLKVMMPEVWHFWHIPSYWEL